MDNGPERGATPDVWTILQAMCALSNTLDLLEPAMGDDDAVDGLRDAMNALADRIPGMADHRWHIVGDQPFHIVCDCGTEHPSWGHWLIHAMDHKEPPMVLSILTEPSETKEIDNEPG